MLEKVRSLVDVVLQELNGWLVKIMGPFWIPILIRHLICRVPKKGP